MHKKTTDVSLKYAVLCKWLCKLNKKLGLANFQVFKICFCEPSIHHRNRVDGFCSHLLSLKWEGSWAWRMCYINKGKALKSGDVLDRWLDR